MRLWAVAWWLSAVGAASGLAGCGPDMNAVANRLRAQTIQQDRTIQTLKEQLAQREATAKQLQAELDNKLPRVETLPTARLDEMFTVAKVEIRSTTDSWDIGGGKGLSAFRVFFRTLTEEGMNIPATGQVTIEAFALSPAPAEPRRLGTWTFSSAEMKKNYYAGMGLNQFACNCPWSAPPTAADVTFRLHFRDALTGRVLEAHLDKKITLPPAGGPK